MRSTKSDAPISFGCPVESYPLPVGPCTTLLFFGELRDNPNLFSTKAIIRCPSLKRGRRVDTCRALGGTFMRAVVAVEPSAFCTTNTTCDARPISSFLRRAVAVIEPTFELGEVCCNAAMSCGRAPDELFD